ncbi:MAG: hypothetical protein R3D70_22905 [Rhizobiaceae bacterium]
MDRLVPGVEPLASVGLVTAPHAGSNDAWRTALCPHCIAEMISSIGAVGKGDYQEFRVGAGIMGRKESHYVPTQRAFDTK